MAGSLGQERRSFLLDHWQPTDESRIEFELTISAGQVPAATVPDKSGGHASAFVRRDCGRPALPGGDRCPRRIQLDQLAAELAGVAEQVACRNGPTEVEPEELRLENSKTEINETVG